MKLNLLRLIVFVVLIASGISCKKENIYDTTFKGKVGYMSCTAITIDIEGGTGGVRWTDPDLKEHLNSVSVKNYCYIINYLSDKKVNGSFTFRISKENRTSDNSCAVYLCLGSGSPEQVFIYDIKSE